MDKRTLLNVAHWLMARSDVEGTRDCVLHSQMLLSAATLLAVEADLLPVPEEQSGK